MLWLKFTFLKIVKLLKSSWPTGQRLLTPLGWVCAYWPILWNCVPITAFQLNCILANDIIGWCKRPHVSRMTKLSKSFSWLFLLAHRSAEILGLLLIHFLYLLFWYKLRRFIIKIESVNKTMEKVWNIDCHCPHQERIRLFLHPIAQQGCSNTLKRLYYEKMSKKYLP